MGLALSVIAIRFRYQKQDEQSIVVVRCVYLELRRGAKAASLTGSFAEQTTTFRTSQKESRQIRLWRLIVRVEDNGLEPMTYALPARRSPN
jgi:hypothetical protein